MARSLTATFSYSDIPENERLLKQIEELAKKDARSRSWIIIEALKEYLANHYPGNPQTDLRVWTGEEGPKGSEWAKSRVKEILKGVKH
jgi:Ribbon-helix-helix protein, copG family